MAQSILVGMLISLWYWQLGRWRGAYNIQVISLETIIKYSLIKKHYRMNTVGIVLKRMYSIKFNPIKCTSSIIKYVSSQYSTI